FIPLEARPIERIVDGLFRPRNCPLLLQQKEWSANDSTRYLHPEKTPVQHLCLQFGGGTVLRWIWRGGSCRARCGGIQGGRGRLGRGRSGFGLGLRAGIRSATFAEPAPARAGIG